MRAWTSNNTIRTVTLKAYLFTIARYLYLEGLRKQKRQVALDETAMDTGPAPDAVIQARMEVRRVQKVLRTLPEIDRAAFILRVNHELPYDEIARVLDLSLSAAKVKVHRVRKKLLFACVDREDHL